MALPSWIDPYFDVLVRFAGNVLPRRPVIEFDGDGVTVGDDSVTKATRVTVPATTLYGDEDDIAHVSAVEVVAEGNDYVEPRSKLGHETTENDTPVAVVLFALGTNERRRIDIIVTATNADATKGGTWTIKAQVRRAGAGAVLVSGGTDADPDAGNTALLDCELEVDGNNVRVLLTGLAAEDITFGWEVRSQKQVIEA